MSRRDSICLRFVDGLRRVIDHLAKQTMKVLRGAEVHPHPACNLNKLFVPSIPNDAAERQIDDAEMVPGLQQGINELNRLSSIPDFQPLIAQGQGVAGPNHHFIGHVSLQSQNASVNASAAGVQYGTGRAA